MLIAQILRAHLLRKTQRAVWVGTGGERGALDHDGHADLNAPKDLHEIDTGAVLIRNTARASAPGRAHEG